MAKRMILCGERLNSEAALRIGLIEDLVPAGGAKARALELALLTERQNLLSVTACKKLIQGARSAPVGSLLGPEREAFVELFGSQDPREGVHAFLHKRKTHWKNA
jgi:enoyl-CoA hydratase/carnithine racemase